MLSILLVSFICLILALKVKDARVVTLLPASYRDIDVYHYDKTIEHVHAFERERRKHQPSIVVLETHKYLFEKHCEELKFRLPNDPALARDVSNALTVLQDRLQRVRRGTTAPLAFPYPISPQDYFSKYGHT